MKFDVLSRGKGGAGDELGRISNLCMTQIDFRGKISRLRKGSDISDMGTMGKDNKNSVSQG